MLEKNLNYDFGKLKSIYIANKELHVRDEKIKFRLPQEYIDEIVHVESSGNYVPKPEHIQLATTLCLDTKSKALLYSTTN